MAMRVKRWIFLVHRWTGIVMCLLLALWFISGVVMLFVGFPKLSPDERLGALPALKAEHCCVHPDIVLNSLPAPDTVGSLVLTSIRNQPHYVARSRDGGLTVVDARSGQLLPGVDATQAVAGAQAHLPGHAASYLGTVEIDRWTRSKALDPHRPLHLVELRDEASTRLYVSSATGQVVQDLTSSEALWNYAGAWLHWLYMFRSTPSDPVWSWTVIVLSALGVVSAATGVWNGLSRWRFGGIYKNGSHSPYRTGVLRWHHLLGLGFGLFLFTWIFSGLMSMNPLGVFDSRAGKPDRPAYEGAVLTGAPLGLTVGHALLLLNEQHVAARELEWKVLNGMPYLLARPVNAGTRIIAASPGGRYEVMQTFSTGQLKAAAARLYPAPIRSHQLIDAHDAYYYKRGQASMYGNDERRLPVLRVEFADAGQTLVYLDMYTGEIALSADRFQRASRWLFNLLHSWDLPAMLFTAWLRDAALIALSIGGLLLSASGTWLGYRRLKAAARARAAAGFQERQMSTINPPDATPWSDTARTKPAARRPGR